MTSNEDEINSSSNEKTDFFFEGPSKKRTRTIAQNYEYSYEAPAKTLREKLNSLLESVHISNSDFEKAIELMTDFGDCVTLPNDNTNLYVGGYRNWYLQLKNSSRNLLHLFVFGEDIKTSSKEQIVKFFNKRDIFETSLFNENFTPVRESENSNNDEIPTSSNTDSSRDLCGWQYRHNETGLKFAAASHPFILCEFQRCRLINYYVGFDSRIIHLFSLVYFWMSTKKIHLGKRKLDFFKSLTQIPDPGAMDMLLVTFLCQKQVLPTLSEIQEQPHKGMYLESKKVDMGFNENPEYAERWKREKSKWTKNQYYSSICPHRRFLTCGRRLYHENLPDDEIDWRKHTQVCRRVHTWGSRHPVVWYW